MQELKVEQLIYNALLSKLTPIVGLWSTACGTATTTTTAATITAACGRGTDR